MRLMKRKILKEIDLIPEDRLIDLYNLVHQYRIDLEKAPNVKNRSILSYAGCWSDLPDEIFEEIAQRIRK